ncbi:4Fe-4S binding protein [Dysosmobacter acutus]
MKRRILGPCATVFTAANTGSWRLERPDVDTDKCVHCGICSQYCPVDCIRVNKAEAKIEFDWNYCKGCGICANECPKHAIRLIEERGNN